MDVDVNSREQETFQPDRGKLSESPLFRTPSQVKILVTLWAVSILIVLIYSSFGRYAIHTTSGDWAQQMIPVEDYYHNAVSPQEEPYVLDAVHAPYPQWSFRMVSFLAVLLDLNPLRSMQVWALLWVVTGCYLLALRLIFHAKERPPLGTIAFTALYLAVCAYAGFGLRGHVEGNWFFAQLAGSVLAIGGLAALERFDWDEGAASLFIVLLGGIVLPNFHLVPAVWFTLAGCIIMLLRTADLRLRILYPVLIGVISLLSWGPQGGSSMVQTANNNGWFLTRLGQLSDQKTAVEIGVCAALMLIFAGLFFLLRSCTKDSLTAGLVPYAGTISICFLISMQFAAYVFFNIGSVYAITKYTYFVAVEGAVLLISIPWHAIKGPEKLLLRNPGLVTAACVFLLFCAQLPFMATTDNQTYLMKVRDRLIQVKAKFNPDHRTYPQFRDLDFDRNYYLAIAVMQIPTDQRTDSWLGRATSGEEAFVWPSQAQILVPNGGFESGTLAPWSLWQAIQANVTGEQVEDGKFSLSENGGEGTVWTDVKGLDVGFTYTVSAQVYAPAGSTAKPQLLIADPTGKTQSKAELVKLEPRWQQLATSIAVVAPGVLRIHLAHSGTGTIYWDDVKIARDSQ